MPLNIQKHFPLNSKVSLRKIKNPNFSSGFVAEIERRNIISQDTSVPQRQRFQQL